MAAAWQSVCSLPVWPSAGLKCAAGCGRAAGPERPLRCSDSLLSRNRGVSTTEKNRECILYLFANFRMSETAPISVASCLVEWGLSW